MNKPYLTIILLIWLTAGSLGNIVTAKTKYNHRQSTKQITQHKFAFKALTAQDRKNYVLTIDQSKIGKAHDTVLYDGKNKIFNVPVKLSNFSNDTLRYLSMSCSWEDFFSINNKKLSIFSWPCQYNTTQDKFILPHKSVTYGIPVIMNGNVRGDKFSIGMNLFIVNNKNRSFTVELILSDYKTRNLIWSNEIIIR